MNSTSEKRVEIGKIVAYFPNTEHFHNREGGGNSPLQKNQYNIDYGKMPKEYSTVIVLILNLLGKSITRVAAGNGFSVFARYKIWVLRERICVLSMSNMYYVP